MAVQFNHVFVRERTTGPKRNHEALVDRLAVAIVKLAEHHASRRRQRLFREAFRNREGARTGYTDHGDPA